MARRPNLGKKLYKPEYADLAYKYALLGATNERMAQFFDVALRTFMYWQAHYPEFKDAIRRGREMADAEIAHSLYQRAKGYRYTEEYYSRKQEATVTVTKELPADPNAAAMWLRKRQRDTWGDHLDGVPQMNPLQPGQVPAGITINFVEAPRLPSPDEQPINGNVPRLVGSSRVG